MFCCKTNEKSRKHCSNRLMNSYRRNYHKFTWVVREWGSWLGREKSFHIFPTTCYKFAFAAKSSWMKSAIKSHKGSYWFHFYAWRRGRSQWKSPAQSCKRRIQFKNLHNTFLLNSIIKDHISPFSFHDLNVSKSMKATFERAEASNKKFRAV